MPKKLVDMNEDERREYNRKAAERSRAKKAREQAERIATEYGLDPFAAVAMHWEENKKQLEQSNPTQYERLGARHTEVVLLEAELRSVELQDGVCNQPSLCCQDILADIAARGSANYTQIEARVVVPEKFKGDPPLDETAENYIQYGLRLQLDSDLPRRIHNLKTRGQQ
jgi:hypothetical protein